MKNIKKIKSKSNNIYKITYIFVVSKYHIYNMYTFLYPFYLK